MSTLKPQRAAKFMPGILQALRMTGIFECKFTDVPKSYQSQPHNLAAKIKSRGAIKSKVFFNIQQNTFTIKRF